MFLDVVLVAISDDDDDDDTNEGLLIGVPLGVFILLASLITVFILLLVLIRSRLMTSILRLPPPPCECNCARVLYMITFLICSARGSKGRGDILQPYLVWRDKGAKKLLLQLT